MFSNYFSETYKVFSQVITAKYYLTLFHRKINFLKMAYTYLNYIEESGTGILTISKPEARNAINDLIIKEINEFIDSIYYSKSLKVLIITGEGKAFVAGADIGKMKNLDAEGGYAWSRTGQETIKRIMNLDIPVIAAVNGYALGGGLELAMSCDIRIASTDAKFGLPEVGLGLIPGYGGTILLARLVGPGDAFNIILSGQMIDASEALRIKLVQKVVEPESLLYSAKALAASISEKSMIAVMTAKKLIRRALETSFDEGLLLETEAFSKMFEADGPEGMKAFLEKRKPVWK
jgi:enoyl-CoA hydratase